MPKTPDKKPPQDLLEWLGIKDAPNWAVAQWLARGFAASLFLLFILSYAAAFGIAGKVVFGGGEVTLGAGGLIAALLGAPFLIWGTILKHQTVRYQKEGHMTDRIAKAVEMLGAEKTESHPARTVKYLMQGKVVRAKVEYLNHTPASELEIGKDEVIEYGEWQVFNETVPNLEVRAGGILSLERIAQDSTTHDKGRDHVRVMEILCAYIRENTNNSRDVKNRNTLRTDVAFAVQVIGRRNSDQLKIENMPETSWKGYRQKYRPNLDSAQLPHVILVDANLAEARLRSVDFSGSWLNRVSFGSSNLENADFSRAFIGETLLSEAKSVGAIFVEAAFRNSDLSKSNLTQKHIDQSFGDTSVIPPGGLPRPQHWLTWEPPLQPADESAVTFLSEWRRWRDTPEGEVFIPAPPPE